MKLRTAIVGVSALTLAASGCGGREEMTTGAIPPGANPGIVLDSPVSTGAGDVQLGAVEGGLMGADVGQSLDDADRALALKAEYEALEYGRPGLPTDWRSGSGNTHGTVSVGASYQVNRLDCRDYSHSISIGGRTRIVRGTACREPDGVWRILG